MKPKLMLFSIFGRLGLLAGMSCKAGKKTIYSVWGVGRHAGRYGESENDAVYHMLTSWVAG